MLSMHSRKYAATLYTGTITDMSGFMVKIDNKVILIIPAIQVEAEWVSFFGK